MKKRLVWLIVVAAVLLTVTVSVTLAMLIASSEPVINTFTVGNVQITLTETTGNDYKLTPGVSLQKDPTVTVKAGSEVCWVFVKITHSTDFDNLCIYSTADGWTALEGESGVYYQRIEKASVNTRLAVLKDNTVTIRDTVTEEQLNAITAKPTLTVYAYAIQADGLANAKIAWQALNS